MKLTLAIEADASALAAILAQLGGTSGVTIQGLPGGNIPGAGGDADDDGNGAPNANAPVTDSTGLPWDERIHAGSKAQIADGTWRKRKGVDAGTVASVEAELRARAGSIQPAAPAPLAAPPQMPQAAPVAAPAPQYIPPAVPQAAPPVMAQPGPLAQPPQMPSYPAPGPVATDYAQPMAATPNYPQSQPAPSAASALDINGLMSGIQRGLTTPGPDGKALIDQTYLQSLCQRISAGAGVTINVVTELLNHPHLISYTQQTIAADGKWIN